VYPVSFDSVSYGDQITASHVVNVGNSGDPKVLLHFLLQIFSFSCSLILSVADVKIIYFIISFWCLVCTLFFLHFLVYKSQSRYGKVLLCCQANESVVEFVFHNAISVVMLVLQWIWSLFYLCVPFG
jgi:hypothetical protein